MESTSAGECGVKFTKVEEDVMKTSEFIILIIAIVALPIIMAIVHSNNPDTENIGKCEKVIERIDAIENRLIEIEKRL